MKNKKIQGCNIQILQLLSTCCKIVYVYIFFWLLYHYWPIRFLLSAAINFWSDQILSQIWCMSSMVHHNKMISLFCPCLLHYILLYYLIIFNIFYSRRTVNKLYPQLELDDTIDQLQSGGGGCAAASQTTRVIPPTSAASHTLKHSPQDRYVWVSAVWWHRVVYNLVLCWCLDKYRYCQVSKRVVLDQQKCLIRNQQIYLLDHTMSYIVPESS